MWHPLLTFTDDPIAPVVVIPPAVPQGGGIPRRHRRVYIKLGQRTLWFANETNAMQFLRDQQREIEQKVVAHVERKYKAVAPKALPELDKSPLPRIVVRGSDDAIRMAQEFDTRMRELLGAIEAQLDEDDEIMLLH